MTWQVVVSTKIETNFIELEENVELDRARRRRVKSVKNRIVATDLFFSSEEATC